MAYAEERPELLARLRQHAGARSLADALRLDGRTLRFHLGTSLADLRAPVALGADLRDAYRAAVRDLFFLLCVRHRASLKESEFDQLLLQDGFDSKALRPISFSSPATVARANVRQAFVEARLAGQEHVGRSDSVRIPVHAEGNRRGFGSRYRIGIFVPAGPQRCAHTGE